MYCRTRHLCLLIALTCLFAMGGLASAATLEVRSDSKTGYATIQAAVDKAAEGDTVIIYPGTYTGVGNRDIDLRRKALHIQGTGPEDARVVEATVLDCQGSAGEPHRGFYAVDFTGEISGLTIANGLASAGGALYCENSALVLSHCHILDNATLPGEAKISFDGGSGGGLYVAGSTVQVVDCLISGNATGAGLDAWGEPGGSGGDGAGLYAIESAVTISESTIADNTTGDGGSGSQGGRGGQGAGLYVVRATIETCMIEGNTAGAGGDSTDVFKGTGGQGGSGGGVFCQNAVEVRDSLVAGNRCGSGGSGATAGADGQGAGIWCAFGLIDHCTVVDNVALGQKSAVFDDSKAVTSLGAGVFCSAETVVTNSILWGNAPDQIAGQDDDYVAFCNIEADVPLAGTGNISADPLFGQSGAWVDASDPTMMVEANHAKAVWTSGDYHLSSTSPCVDAGDPDYIGDVDGTDLDGQARISGAAVDMGAYEVQGLVAVYRFISPKTGKYFYTPDEVEKDRLIDQFADAWTFEGIAYYASASASDEALMPVYRFWSPKSDSHFWTINEGERDWLIDRYPDVWTYEGLAFYAYPEGSQPAGAKPVYRFRSATLDAHFYTIDEVEKQAFIDTLSDLWVYESIAWYAFDENQTGQTPDPSEGVGGLYELSGQENAMAYVLELKAYLDGQEAQLDHASVTFVSAVARMQMAMDFDAMTAELTGLHMESEFLPFSATVSEIGGTIELPFDLYLNAYFDSSVARGPYAIDPTTLSFPSMAYGDTAGADDVCTFVGSAALEGEKFDVNIEVNPTGFETGLAATFAGLDDSGRLDVDMTETFRWTRSERADLLLQANIRGHLVELYIVSTQVRTMGPWVGKLVQGDEKSEK